MELVSSGYIVQENSYVTKISAWYILFLRILCEQHYVQGESWAALELGATPYSPLIYYLYIHDFSHQADLRNWPVTTLIS